MKCENCGGPVSEDYVNRVCAAQLDELEEVGPWGYLATITCNCCETCHKSVCRWRDEEPDLNPAGEGGKS